MRLKYAGTDSRRISNKL